MIVKRYFLIICYDKKRGETNPFGSASLDNEYQEGYYIKML